MTSRLEQDLERLEELVAEAAHGGGEALARRHHRLGRLLPRERIDALVDPGSFCELGALQRTPAGAGDPPPLGDGVVAGLGRVQGRPVALYAHDPTVLRGALGVGGARKIVRVLQLAEEQRLPVIALLDSDGVRVHEGPRALAGFAEVLGRIAQLSGWVPQIGVVLGLCVGGAAYASALMDVVVGHEEQGFLFVTGAKVTRVVTGQDDALEELGGVPMHARMTGLVHLVEKEERACLALAGRVLSYLPQCAGDAPGATAAAAASPATGEVDPLERPTPEILEVLPATDRKAYDMRKLLRPIFDQGSFLELQAEHARNLVIGFARLGGRPLGVLASQPLVEAGALEIQASRKGARFIQLCNAFGLPIVTLVDVPGFRPGKEQEQGGLLLHGAKLIAAYAACAVPLVTLIVRKSYGGGNVLSYPGDIRLAYPFARVQPMGTEAALAVASHRTFGDVPPEEVAAFREQFVKSYDAMGLAAQAGYVDRIIRPEETRLELGRALELVAARPRRPALPPRRLANIPL